MIGLQRLYYKGVSQENVQDNVRTIIDDVNQEIQTSNSTPDVTWAPDIYRFNASFNNNPPTTYHVNAVCIGTVRYVYIVGLQVSTNSPLPANQIAQALWRDTTPGGGCGSSVPQIDTATPSDGGLGYVAAGSRLTAFQISLQSNGNYAVTVSIADGSDDLLNTNINTSNNVHCTGGSGDQFCATASLMTEVGQRVQ